MYFILNVPAWARIAAFPSTLIARNWNSNCPRISEFPSTLQATSWNLGRGRIAGFPSTLIARKWIFVKRSCNCLFAFHIFLYDQLAPIIFFTLAWKNQAFKTKILFYISVFFWKNQKLTPHKITFNYPKKKHFLQLLEKLNVLLIRQQKLFLYNDIGFFCFGGLEESFQKFALLCLVIWVILFRENKGLS